MDIESTAEKYWAQVQYKYKCKVVFWGDESSGNI